MNAPLSMSRHRASFSWKLLAVLTLDANLTNPFTMSFAQVSSCVGGAMFDSESTVRVSRRSRSVTSELQPSCNVCALTRRVPDGLSGSNS